MKLKEAEGPAVAVRKIARMADWPDELGGSEEFQKKDKMAEVWNGRGHMALKPVEADLVEADCETQVAASREDRRAAPT